VGIIRKGEVYTTERTAKLLNISTTTVRSIERKALSKCLLWCQRNSIKLDDLLDLNRPIGRGHSSIE
jgi:DNA-directed RNA polymerase sigma subunit (sigma70/sigma32)